MNLDQTIIFWIVSIATAIFSLVTIIFVAMATTFSCCYGNHINLLPLATSNLFPWLQFVSMVTLSACCP